jgi:hypothetical protein
MPAVEANRPVNAIDICSQPSIMRVSLQDPGSFTRVLSQGLPEEPPIDPQSSPRRSRPSGEII